MNATRRTFDRSSPNARSITNYIQGHKVGPQDGLCAYKVEGLRGLAKLREEWLAEGVNYARGAADVGRRNIAR